MSPSGPREVTLGRVQAVGRIGLQLGTDLSRKLSPEVILKMVDMESRCWTHARIGEMLGITRVTVTRYLSRHATQLYAKFLARAAAIKGRQLAQLENVADAAMQAFEVKPSASFLGAARRASGDIRRILGIDTRTDPHKDAAAGSPSVVAALYEIERIEEAIRF